MTFLYNFFEHSVRRLTIGVLLRMHGDKSLLERIREQVAATVGANAERGDVISLFAQESFAAGTTVTPRSESMPPASVPPAIAPAAAQPEPAASLAADRLDLPKLWFIAAVAVAAAALILLAAAALRWRRLRSLPVRRLTHEERAATAERLRELLKQADPHAARG